MGEAHDFLGGIDILVNNVGIMSDDNFIEDLDEKSWDKIIETNLKGIFLRLDRLQLHS